MRIGIISDIHGNSSALQVVLSALLDEVDQVVFLGDLCGYYPFVDECIALWDASQIVGIRGNHDQVLLDCLQNGREPSLDYEARYGSALRRTLHRVSSKLSSLLLSLPLSRTLTINGTVLVLFHGTPWDPLGGRVYPDYTDWERFSDVPGDVILLGHTHYPLVRRYQDKLIANPGSVGQPRDRPGEACFSILDLTSGAVQYRHRRVAFDARCLIEDAQKHDPNLSYLAEVLSPR